MLPISDTQLAEAATIIGAAGATEVAIEADVLALAGDPFLARRVIDWLPEAFAFVLIPHVAPVTLPTTFSARAEDGRWITFGFDVEPIFQRAVRLGREMFHGRAGETFGNVALRSSTLAAVNNALNAGVEIKGAVLSAPALVGVRAEVYLKAPAFLTAPRHQRPEQSAEPFPPA